MRLSGKIPAYVALATAAFLAVATVGLDRWINNTELPSLAPETSVTVNDRHGDLLRAYTVADGLWRLPVTLDDIDPQFVRALVAFEDKRFFSHSGVDLRAMMRATAQALWNGEIVSGGSTLTMQVARLLEDGGTGRWRPKLRQIRLALALERSLNKDDILDLYMKLAPYGGNLEGIRAATLSYFGKEPQRLTAAQIAFLVALPQSPETRRPDRHPDTMRSARDRVLGRLASAGVLPLDEAQAATDEILPTTRRDFPNTAPHSADFARRTAPLRGQHRLTIDRDLQISLEQLAASRIAETSPGISVALLVMDHTTGEMLASVGSAGFLDQERSGPIDMTRAIRSPGSTLKPLIYGLAFDAGLAHPETLIVDAPTDFGGYAPQNFDSRFRGELPVRRALQLSLNVPAVKLLDAVGPAVLISRMMRAGVKARLPGHRPPGLAIALGGLGLSLRDLVTLYGALANGGVPVAAIDRLDQHRVDAGKPLMSPESAWQVADILTGVVGPRTAPKNNLAYKTGTSYGHRDAWAIGFDGQHVIGVWIGRADGASMPGALGASTAAPILFEAFGRLKPKLAALPPPPPATLIVSHVDLPQPLKTFRRRGDLFGRDDGAPEIIYPPNGARVDLRLGSIAMMPLVLKLRGGTPPFTWLAEGRPFDIASRTRRSEYAPDGPGFVTISVIDAAGRAQRTRVRVE